MRCQGYFLKLLWGRGCEIQKYLIRNEIQSYGCTTEGRIWWFNGMFSDNIKETLVSNKHVDFELLY